VRVESVADPASIASSSHRILSDLVAGGAALGWVEPPSYEEIAALLAGLVEPEAALRVAYQADRVVGLGYWRRYARPTHRPHANLERIAVESTAQGAGVGRAIVVSLIEAADRVGVEVLTLDVRADNASARHLYEALGFVEYGRLARFVAVGDARYDKVFYALDLRERRAASNGVQPVPRSGPSGPSPTDHL
jgi:ribosomal protein S18 acetylase RimI-like enzyme